MTVVRFCARFGIPTSTWYYWRAAYLSGTPARRWPTPVLDAVEALAAEKKDDERFSAWGHRKIFGLLREDGVEVSASSVKRALARRGLLLPVRYHAERRALARARKGIFRLPTPRRNRVWQTDFSEFETTRAGSWMLTGVVDYWAKVCLTSSANGTQTARDVVHTIEAAIAETEVMLGVTLQQDCVDGDTGEIFPVVIVSDNGPGYKSDLFARFIAARPWLAHVRTRYRSPQTNGVIERFYGSLKYEHLYRREIASGIELNDECHSYRLLYNQIRPHEALGLRPPIRTYLAEPMSFDAERAHIAAARLAIEKATSATPSPADVEEIPPISDESVQEA